MLPNLAECSGLYFGESRHICTLLQILHYVLSGSEMRSEFYLCESSGKEFLRQRPEQWGTVLGCGWERNLGYSSGALLWSDKELNRVDVTGLCHRLLSRAEERA